MQISNATFLPLLVGFILGMIFAFMTTYFQQGNLRSTNKCFPLKDTDVKPALDTLKKRNVTAELLYNKTRVLCWIMTSPTNLYKRAVNVRDTWTKRCDMRLFMSSKEDKNFPTIGLPVIETRAAMYEKTKEAYKYLWQHHKDDADWFMKADDDTYVIPENMRFFLKDHNPNSPIYFGHKFKNLVKQGYMSGGAGYILSREAVRRYVEGITSKKCAKGGGIEDMEIGKCMENVGVIAGDSRDEEGKASMHPLNPVNYVIKDRYNYAKSSTVNDFYPACGGVNCTTSYPISYHAVTPEEMHVIDYFIYKVKVRGRTILAKP